jgi:hypothetical protein
LVPRSAAWLVATYPEIKDGFIELAGDAVARAFGDSDVDPADVAGHWPPGHLICGLLAMVAEALQEVAASPSQIGGTVGEALVSRGKGALTARVAGAVVTRLMVTIVQAGPAIHAEALGLAAAVVAVGLCPDPDDHDEIVRLDAWLMGAVVKQGLHG